MSFLRGTHQDGGKDLSTLPLTPASARPFLPDPQVHRGIRYRCERDGSVVMATPEGPRRFENWGQFWEVVN